MTEHAEHTENSDRRLISVVIPCYNEEKNVLETHRRLNNVFAGEERMDVEYLYVDDGSRDCTVDQLKALRAGDEAVKIISLSRNFGHQVAVTAGIEHAIGDAVVIIDADLQDPPEVILNMIHEWRNGAHVVYGVRQERDGETPFKRWTAKLFYRMINKMSEVPLPLDSGDFRLMDRQAVDALLAMPERDRYVRGMTAWIGFNQVPVLYKRDARYAGESKYPLLKMLGFAADGIVSFSMMPLRLAVWMGFCTSGLALLGIAYALMLRLLTHIWVPGWTLLFIAVLFLGGVQLVFLGIIGEYLGRVYGEVKRRPLYIIKQKSGFAGDQPSNRKSIQGPV